MTGTHSQKARVDAQDKLFTDRTDRNNYDRTQYRLQKWYCEITDRRRQDEHNPNTMEYHNRCDDNRKWAFNPKDDPDPDSSDNYSVPEQMF